MGFIFVPIYISYIGIEAYGLIGLFILFQGLVALLDMGLSPTLNREMAKFRAGAHTLNSIWNLLRTVEIIYFIIAVLLLLIIFNSAPLIANSWLNVQNMDIVAVIEAIELIGLILAIRWMSVIYRSAIVGLQEHIWLNIWIAIFATIRGIGVILVLNFISPTIQAFFIFHSVIAVLELILLFLKIKFLIPLPSNNVIKFSIESIKNVWKFAGGMMLITALATLLTQIDKVLLSKLLPLEQFGYFSLAVTIAGMLSLFIGPINNVAFPHFTQLVTARRKNEIIAYYHRFSQIMTIMIVPVALVISFFSHELIYIWSQDEKLSNYVSPIVSVWIIGTALNGLMHIPYVVQISYGWSRLTIITNGIAIILVIPLFLYFVPIYGAIGAAWIWVGINIGYIVFSISYMHKKILRNEKWKWYIKDLIIPSMTSLLVVFIGKNILDNLDLSNAFLLVFYICTVGVITLIMTIISTQTGRDYILKYIRKGL